MNALAEATINPSNDYAVKLSCSSLLLEAWSLEPEIIAPKRGQADVQGITGAPLKD